MKPEKRSPAIVILLSIVTCGIYYLFWIYSVSREVRDFLGDPGINPGTELILCIVTCGIYSYYWHYKYNQKMQIMLSKAGMPLTDNSILCVVLAIFGLSIVSIAIEQNQLNSIWDNTYYRG